MTDHGESAETVDESYPSLRRNWAFLRLLFGRLVTNAGDSLYVVATMWLVHDLTGSTVYTGIAEFLVLLPLALQFVAGPLVDRWPIVRALVAIQVVQAVAILSLPVAVYTETLTVERLIVLIPILTLLNQFVYPAQTAALPRIVAEDQLTRANSAFSFAFHGVDMLFEAVGGVLIAVVGAASLFVLDSVTFVVAALSFVGIRLPRTEDAGETTETSVSGYLADLTDGFEWLRGTVFLELALTAAVSNFALGMTFAVLPRFADIRGGPALYGGLLGALGVGSALGAAVAPRLEGLKFGHVQVLGLAGKCVLWLGAVYAPWPILAIGLFGLAWVPSGVSNVMANTLEQTVVPNHVLGRVASTTASTSSIPLPIGALVGGLVGSVIGSVNTVALGGVAFGLMSVYSALRPPLRRLPATNDIDPTEFNVRVDGFSSSERSE